MAKQLTDEQKREVVRDHDRIDELQQELWGTSDLEMRREVIGEINASKRNIERITGEKYKRRVEESDEDLYDEPDYE